MSQSAPSEPSVPSESPEVTPIPGDPGSPEPAPPKKTLRRIFSNESRQITPKGGTKAQGAASSSGGPTPPPAPLPSSTASDESGPVLESLPENVNARIVPVYFGTNRRTRSPPPTDNEPEDWYTTQLGPLQFGICRVSVPRNRSVGTLDTATKEDRDPATRFVLQRLEVSKNGLQWVAGIAESLSQTPSDERDLLVFVHGFNVSFADSVYRTAQLKQDLDFKGPALTFSWPSRGSLSGYRDDEKTSEKSVNDFEQFMRIVLSMSKANKIHVIAHSMGNRVMTPALANIAVRPESEGATIDQIILAAPDIDARVFHDTIAPRFMKAGLRRTLYASQKDNALRASYLIHELASRLGDSVDHVRGLAMEAVDAKLSDTSLLSHSYYGDEPLVIEDIREVLNGKAPGDRNLVRQFENTWSFKLAESGNLWSIILLIVMFAAGLLVGVGLCRWTHRS